MQPASQVRGGVSSLQLMVESRAGMPGFDAALRRGPAFGAEMFSLLAREYPAVSGVIFDFERGPGAGSRVTM